MTPIPLLFPGAVAPVHLILPVIMTPDGPDFLADDFAPVDFKT